MKNLLAALLALGIGGTLALGACQPLAGLPASGGTASERYALSGTVSFDARAVQIAPSQVVNQATLALIDPSNKTVAVGRTNAAGAFSLVPGSGFAATDGATFTLDAYKAVSTNGNMARMRTVLRWTNAGWTSTSGAALVINPLTTAVSVIQALRSGTVTPADTIGTVTGATVASGKAEISGNWTAVNQLVRDLLAKDQDPVARIAYQGGAFVALPNKAQPLVLGSFMGGSHSDTRVDALGKLMLAGPRPAPNVPFSESDYFFASGVGPDIGGTVVSDGTYLYVKGWDNYGNKTPNMQIFKKIGSGFNGTVRGALYGLVGPSTSKSMGAAYLKGHLYVAVYGVPTEIQKVSVKDGSMTTLTLPAPMIERGSGLPGTVGYRMFTSDGRYLYVLAYGVNGQENKGFTVQVLDPDQGFAQVRLFTMDSTSYYCDGVLCDGTYIYPMNFTRGPSAEMRRYRLSDGAREAAWTFPMTNYVGNYQPDENNPISGSWDPYNKVFWVGNIGNEKIHLLRGGSFIPSGTWTSATIDTGSADPHFGRFDWLADLNGKNTLGFQVRSADTTVDLANATWYGPAGTADAYLTPGTPLNPVHAKHRYLQIRATMTSADQLTSPALSQMSVEVLP